MNFIQDLINDGTIVFLTPAAIFIVLSVLSAPFIISEKLDEIRYRNDRERKALEESQKEPVIEPTDAEILAQHLEKLRDETRILYPLASDELINEIITLQELQVKHTKVPNQYRFSFSDLYEALNKLFDNDRFTVEEMSSYSVTCASYLQKVRLLLDDDFIVASKNVYNSRKDQGHVLEALAAVQLVVDEIVETSQDMNDIFAQSFDEDVEAIVDFANVGDGNSGLYKRL